MHTPRLAAEHGSSIVCVGIGLNCLQFHFQLMSDVFIGTCFASDTLRY
jgi:hypothetical protein